MHKYFLEMSFLDELTNPLQRLYFATYLLFRNIFDRGILSCVISENQQGGFIEDHLIKKLASDWYSYVDHIDYWMEDMDISFKEYLENPKRQKISRQYVENSIRLFKALEKPNVSDLCFSDNVRSPEIIDGWIFCHNCIDAFQPDIDIIPIVRCPKCRIPYQNPEYIKYIQEGRWYEEIYQTLSDEFSRCASITATQERDTQLRLKIEPFNTKAVGIDIQIDSGVLVTFESPYKVEDYVVSVADREKDLESIRACCQRVKDGTFHTEFWRRASSRLFPASRLAARYEPYA